MKRKLILMDMTNAGNVNGVTRCVGVLAEALARDNSFDVLWIRFVHGGSNEVQSRISKGYTLLFLPLSKNIGAFLRYKSVRLNYWEQAHKTLLPFLDGNPILHIHTLNLIEFAIFIKDRMPCKIVTHLHCLPWKGLYNTDIKRFNQLYELYYIKRDYHNPSLFIRQEHELSAYTKSDCVVCVTECARDFIYRTCPEHTDIRVISNGIQDLALSETRRTDSKPLRCLFVGSSHTSKGLGFVLAAMQGVLIQHPAMLTIVGAIPKTQREKILSQFPFLDIHFTGQVEFGLLRRIYADSDIGLIGSIQEQCSYVAIEMMMAGLPVITTDVDGLDELFIDGYNGTKIPVTFNAKHGLQVDVIKMSEAIIQLGRNAKLRKQMGRNARKQYLKRHSLKQMIGSMKEIYTSLTA